MSTGHTAIHRRTGLRRLRPALPALGMLLLIAIVSALLVDRIFFHNSSSPAGTGSGVAATQARSLSPFTGARARDVRRIFATEGLVVAIAGWLLGVPLGYLLARGIGSLAGNAVGLDMAFVFPVTYVLIALIGTVILALVIMLAPLRRAVNLKPGQAIRYA